MLDTKMLARGTLARFACLLATMTLRRSIFAVAACLSACLPGATVKPPHAPVRSEIAPGRLSSPIAQDTGPLRVVFATPRDSASPATEVVVVFSKQMRALGASETDAEIPLVLTPNVPGKTSWAGTAAVKFIPNKPFSKASSFHVEIPKGIKAADGTTLDESYAFSFTTERPDISGTDPASGAKQVPPDRPITLYFNQPVSASELSRTVTLSANKRTIPFTMTDVERDSAVVKPRAPLPRSSEITVHIDPTLRAIEGDLTMGKPKDITFRTLEPFAMAGIQCTPHPTDKGACDPNEQDVTLTLTTPLPSELVEQAITIDPAMDSFYMYESGGEENGPSEIRIQASFEPGKTYSVGVRSNLGGRPLRDIHGQLVSKQTPIKLRFGDLPADVTFGASGIYWPPGKHILPVGVLNAPEATISIIPIHRDELLERLVGQIKPLAASAAPKRRIVPGGKTNETNWQRVSVDDLLPTTSTKGPVLARASFPTNGGSRPAIVEREMQLTDMGLFTKTSPDEAVVWVTRLSDGAAMGGARASLYELPDKGQTKLLSTSIVDPTGLSVMPVRLGEPRSGRLAVVVEQGDDLAYQTIKAPPLADPLGTLFTSRGIYRPGEHVEIKGLVRLPVTSGLVTPKEGDVTLRVTDPNHREIARSRRSFSRFGTFSAVLPIPTDAPLGLYHVDAKFARGSLRWHFSVDQYRPVETKAFASFDKHFHVPGDRAFCTARGEHLYGAPMAGATANVVVHRGYGSFSIPGLERFSLGMHDANVPTVRIAQASGKLDARGSFSVPVSTALPAQVTTETLTCEVEIVDFDKRMQVAEDSAIVHPADVYVALENPEHFWIAPEATLTPRALVVTPSGERRAAPVHMKMLHRARKDDRSFEDRPIASCDVTTGQTPVGCKFVVPKLNAGADDEIIIRATTTDGHGRAAMTSYAHRIEAVSVPSAPSVASTNTPAPPPPSPPPPPPEVPPPTLKIEMDPVLAVGKTARVTLSSPFQKTAKAMVTFEREGIIFRRALDLLPAGTNTVFDVSVTPAMMPNISATVTVISGNEVRAERTDVRVDASSKQLRVDVRPDKMKVVPGETLGVEVVVTDSAGKPARGVEVTLWAADEGSLVLTNYRTPDPWYALFSDRDVLVRSDDARDELLTTWMGRHRVKPPQVRMGATSMAPRRGDFRQTVVFLPDLVTGSDGRVKRSITLPDGLTAYRFMAVAVAEDDRTGSGDAAVHSSKPFMVRPTLPRVMRAGDEFDASVVLSTIDLPLSNATIAARAKGFAVRGAGRKVVQVGPDAPTEVLFPMRADHVGKVSFSVDGSLSSGHLPHVDNVDLHHEVHSPTPLEKVVVSGETSTAIAERIATAHGIRPDAGGLSVTLSPSPLTSMVSGLEQLVEYPYGCTEQTVSRLVPLLALRDIADAFGVSLMPLAPGKTVPEALQQAVDSVLGNQQEHGGFGLWPASRTTDPWVTAYALWGLSEASRRGVVVPKEALDRAVAAVERVIDGIGSEANGLALERAAFGLDVLASMGRGNEAKMKALFAERARLSVEARALLLHAYAALAPSAKAEIDALTSDVRGSIRIDGPRAHVESSGVGNEFGSNVVATAMVMRALLATDPGFPMASAMAPYLARPRIGGKYATTHDAAWALLSLDAYRKTLPDPKREFDAHVFLGNTLLADVHLGGEALSGKTLRVPMQDVVKATGGLLTFDVVGSGKLHYDVTLEFARNDMSTQPIDAGFFVTKTWRRASEFGESAMAVSKEEPTFVRGDIVVCEIEVVTPKPRSFVVLEDPMAGGFEALSLDYREGRAWLARIEASPADRREKRDDKMVYFIDALPAGMTRFRYLARAMHTGRFHAPPTRVEEMYEPSVFGQTAASRVRVQGLSE